MKSWPITRCLLASALTVAIITSCAVDHASDALACTTQADCDSSRICSDGYCIVGMPSPSCPTTCKTCDLATKTCAIDNGGDKVTCPAGWNCSITCANGRCSEVDCSSAASCAVQCGSESCDNVKCGAGPCQITCSGQGSCKDVDCRSSCACDVTCTSSSCETTRCPGTTCNVNGGGCTSGPAACTRC